MSLTSPICSPSWLHTVKSSWLEILAGLTSPVTGTPGVSVVVPASVAVPSAGLSVAVPFIASVASMVTGGGEPATFVLVAPPPQATSTIADMISIDNRKLILLISFHTPLLTVKFLNSLKKKVTLREQGRSRTFSIETLRSVQNDTL